jgi:DNA modification methylase
MLTPYYSHAGIALYHADCRDVLPTLTRDSVDLLLTDPPYGVRWQSGRRQVEFGLIIGDESTDAAVEGVRLSLPILRNKRHLYVFGRYDFAGLLIAEPVELIWDKVNSNASGMDIPWMNQHEYIQFAVQIRSAQNRQNGNGNGTARLRRGTVLRYPRLNATAVKDHPSEKPVPLLRELIESSSCIGETVLDPFVGVGSTLEAAMREGRRAIGIEIEERYCEIAARRCERLAPLLAQLEMALAV